MSAATIIPDRLRGNAGNFIFLDIMVDDDFDKRSFQDLIFSFRHNYTLRYLTLVRTGPKEEDEEESVDGSVRSKSVPKQRSIKELRLLVREILNLPRLEMLDFENFTNDEVAQFDDLLMAATRVQ